MSFWQFVREKRTPQVAWALTVVLEGDYELHIAFTNGDVVSWWDSGIPLWFRLLEKKLRRGERV